ncbi:MAG: cyclopropane-fatty-acyl-phospholipid synthase family protein [Alphaproteobacteria bacterium]|nr:cyclopropane-fatty-acyl-phospholipid synthase family protein [Alphaproteobacteria bacterium]
MSLVEHVIAASERVPLPDFATRAGIHFLVDRTKRQLARQPGDATETFARDMASFPIALSTDAANEQHYEIPARFFELTLGGRRKYSCGYYETSTATLDEAEESALAITAQHADLANGQRILELGCGWGSLTLWMAEHYPDAQITAVSNSKSQRDYILSQLDRHGFQNVDVITADMNNFVAGQSYDRVVSVEMFEHIANWRELIGRVAEGLKPDGRFFMHVFSHHSQPYRFDHRDKTDWIAQHFFTGGIMPSHNLIHQFSDLIEVEEEWQWSGEHYARTAQHWLENFDRNRGEIADILRGVYGDEGPIWQRRWRWFYLATMGLFGHEGGREWGISHYRMRLK